jgi:hypothetical protein
MEAEMNAKFVRQHLRSGKSRMRPNRRFPKAAWFGAPKSAQFLRCYPKPPVRGFRLEVQFNRGAIENNGLDDLDAWSRLPEVVARYVAFYRMDWTRLTAYVRRHFRRDPEAVLQKARGLRGNLDQLLRLLRRVGVSNPAGFLRPMPVNEDIAQALAKWKRQWKRDGRV